MLQWTRLLMVERNSFCVAHRTRQYNKKMLPITGANGSSGAPSLGTRLIYLRLRFSIYLDLPLHDITGYKTHYHFPSMLSHFILIERVTQQQRRIIIIFFNLHSASNFDFFFPLYLPIIWNLLVFTRIVHNIVILPHQNQTIELLRVCWFIYLRISLIRISPCLPTEFYYTLLEYNFGFLIIISLFW